MSQSRRNGVLQHPLSEQRADQLYLRLDGLNKMLADLLMDIYGIRWGTVARITRAVGTVNSRIHFGNNVVSLYDYAGGNYVHLVCLAWNKTHFTCGGAGETPVWKAWDGSAYREFVRIPYPTAGFQITRADDITGLAGKTLDFPLFKVGGVAGVDGSFTTVDGKTVTVSKGLITSIV